MNTRISDKEKLILLSNLGTMLAAGIPILEAVDSLLEETKGSQKKIIQQIRKDLSEGNTLSTALARFPKSFDPVTINLVGAAENAGNLETVLGDLTVMIRKEAEFGDKVKAALTYPLLVLITFTLILSMILTFVIPRIATVFTRLNVQLPLPTKILIVMSNFFIQFYPWLLGVGVVLLVFGIYTYTVNKRAVINMFFSLPLLSKLGRLIDLTRFTRSMGLLLSSGIPIVDALTLSKEVLIKKEIVEVVERSKKLVASGKQFSIGLKEKRSVISPIVIRMIETGEKSGTLEKAMQTTSEYLDNEVNVNLKSFTTLLEPILLLLVGSLVGGMMLAIIAPIYGLIGQINGG